MSDLRTGFASHNEGLAFLRDAFDHPTERKIRKNILCCQGKKPTQAWRLDHYVCFANTKSEARGVFKKLLELKRLPKGASVTRTQYAQPPS